MTNISDDKDAWSPQEEGTSASDTKHGAIPGLMAGGGVLYDREVAHDLYPAESHVPGQGADVTMPSKTPAMDSAHPNADTSEGASKDTV